MPTHAERRAMPYTPNKCSIWSPAVDLYPQFLPWCLASRITKREGNVFYADLVIGYKMVREKFGSRVTALKPDHIHVEYLSGPMKHLSNHWRFSCHKQTVPVLSTFTWILNSRTRSCKS
jgi:coenzyme Q-binding protein COQ10